jgi:hypothetical protein
MEALTEISKGNHKEDSRQFAIRIKEYVQEQFIHPSDRCSTSLLIDSSLKFYWEQTTKVARMCTGKVQELVLRYFIMTANNVELKTSGCRMLGILLNENRRNSQ